ncbi:MAG: hypothetical protein GFH24_608438n2 [Chloroflexi bacterium AL-N5]|nr:hypothetical protein [Chloroflexi bacterium AL-N5]
MNKLVVLLCKAPKIFLFVIVFQFFFSEKGCSEVRRANDFIDSIGVTTHVRFEKLTYNTKYNQPNGGWRRLLIESGIRHIRDEIPNNPGKEYYWWPRINDLAANGIKSNLIVNFSPYLNGRPRTYPEIESEIVQHLGWLKNNLLSSVESIEAVNEPRGFGWEKAFGKGRDGWINRVKFYHRKLHEHSKSDPSLAHLPILGSAWGALWYFNATDVGDLSPYVDYGNFHPYPGGRAPEESFLDNTFLQMRDRLQKYNFPGRQMIVTEVGYHNSLNDRQTLHHYIPEDLEAIYAPRMFLEYFRLGFRRTYYYEFLDGICNPRKDKVNLTFGMIDCNLNPKPTYYSMKNLISILNDKNLNSDNDTKFEPQKLDYNFFGDTSDARHILLQKKNGKYYIVVWRALSIWNVDQKKRLPFTPKYLRLNLPRDIYISPKYYLPNNSTNGLALAGNGSSSIQFPVDARPIVIEFSKRPIVP